MMKQRYGFCPFTHMNQPRAKCGFLVQLLVIEVNQPSPHLDCYVGTDCSIEQRRTKQPRADHPEHAGERHNREDPVHHHDDEGQGDSGEGLHIIGNPLIRMLDPALANQFVIHAVVSRRTDIQPDKLGGHEVTPQQPQALLAKAKEHRHQRRAGENEDIQKSLTNKDVRVSIRQGAHEITANIAVDDIQGVEGNQQNNQGNK